MTDPTLNEVLIKAMKSKIPDGTGLANVLINILFIGKEAVYRRLRGEVSFTLNEAATISRELGISLDNIVGSRTTKNALFDLNIIDTSNPIDTYRKITRHYCDTMKEINLYEDTEVGIAANLIPQISYLKYTYLSKFRFYKWLYQNDKANSLCPFSEVNIPVDIRNLQKEYVRESQHVRKTTYILDNHVFGFFLKDLQYFIDINLINKEDIKMIQNDLMVFLDDLEDYTAKGRFKTGADLQVYISNVNFEATYSYISSPLLKIAMYRLYSINSVTSTDPVVFNYNKDFIHSLKKYSTLISESAEMQRIKFFNKQREIIRSI